jgi:hypothetical protein
MRETCHEVLKELGTKDDLLEVAMELEHIALNDPYFIEKKLYPNVDFYSGIILKAMGIPSSMFTVIFAMARTVGWIAHWNEMHSDGMKIASASAVYRLRKTRFQKRYRPLSQFQRYAGLGRIKRPLSIFDFRTDLYIAPGKRRAQTAGKIQRVPPSPCRQTVSAATCAHSPVMLRTRLCCTISRVCASDCSSLSISAGLGARHQAAVRQIAAVGENFLTGSQLITLSGAD